jgi:hypothetical protein
VSRSVAVVTTSTPSTRRVIVPPPELRTSKLSAPVDARSRELSVNAVSVAPPASPSRIRSAPAVVLIATSPAPAGEWLVPTTP